MGLIWLGVVVWLGLSGASFGQSVTGTSLRIEAADGSVLTFDGAEGLKVVDGSTGVIFRFHQGERWIWNPVTLNGLRFFGNEETIFGTNDPPKLRLASNGGNLGAVSFNRYLLNPVDHEEVATFMGSLSSDDQTSLGAHVALYARRKYVTGDTAQVRVWGVTTAGTSDGWPRLYLDNPTFTLGPWLNNPLSGSSPTSWPPCTSLGSFGYQTPGCSSVPPPPPPSSSGPVGPTAVVAAVNLSGGVSALTIGDGSWLTAINGGHDSEVSVDLALSGQTVLDVEVRRTGTSGTAPYLYIWANDVTLVSARQIEGAETVTVALPVTTGTVRVRIRGSAQAGTVEVGGVRAR